MARSSPELHADESSGYARRMPDTTVLERWNAMTGKTGLKADRKASAGPRDRAGRDQTDDAAARDTHVAAALRSAYEEAVREDVPAEFLDLLGKLS